MNSRALFLSIPRWQIITSGVDLNQVAVVVDKNLVIDATPRAIQCGIQLGIQRREAQRLCPSVEITEHDEESSVASFNALVVVLESITPRIEITVSGQCSFPTRGPSRYFGGDELLAGLVGERIAEALSATFGVDKNVATSQFRIGVADSYFAALIAASSNVESNIHIVETGGNADFLAPFSLHLLRLDSALAKSVELISVLQRLGIETLGDLVALPSEELLARFGKPGVLAQQLAQGVDFEKSSIETVSGVLMEEHEIDPPANRIDTVLFSAKSLADQICQDLYCTGTACRQILIEVESEHGELSSRFWRHEYRFTSADITDRVRWQLEGWYRSSAPPTGPLSLVRLVAEEVIRDDGYQLEFWGKQTSNDEQAIRSFTRVQEILGIDSVTVAQHGKGRRSGDIEQRVPLSSAGFIPDRQIALPEYTNAPWPGRLPAPLPVLVLGHAELLQVIDLEGCEVRVNGRGLLSGEPARLRSDSLGSHLIKAWSGPWLVDERWWDPIGKDRRARFQFLLENGAGYLCVLRGGSWWLEASYD